MIFVLRRCELTPDRGHGDAHLSNSNHHQADAGSCRMPSGPRPRLLFDEYVSPRPRTRVKSHLLSTEMIADTSPAAPACLPEERGPDLCSAPTPSLVRAWIDPH